MDSDSESIEPGSADGADGNSGEEPNNIRRFTETVQLRSALGEVPKRPPAVAHNVNNLLPLAAAVALVIIGGLITVLATDSGSGDQAAGATLLAEGAAIDLDVTATAALLESDNQSSIRLNFDRDLQAALIDDGMLDPDVQYLALWLTDPGRQEVLPLGVVYDDAVVPMPVGVDIAEFSVIDVSIEPLDGQPGHSGRTIMRGVLEPS